MFWRGVWGYLPANALAGVVGFLNIVVFTRLLSPEEFGRYALAYSVMTTAHTVIFTWLEAAMARFFAAEETAGGVPSLFATLYRTFAALALIYVPLAALAIWLWPAETGAKTSIGAALAAVLSLSLARMVQERRRAAGDVSTAAAIDMTRSGGAFLIGAGLAALGLGGAAPILGFGLAALLCLPFTLPRELKMGRSGHFDPARLKDYGAYGYPVAASLVLAVILTNTDRFLLAAMLGPAEVGAYHAGYSLAFRTLDVLFIWLGAASGPALVMALERGGPAALREAGREQAGVFVLVTLPAAVGIALVARPLGELMVGEALRDQAALVTPWIAAGAFFAGLTTYYLYEAFTLARRTGLLLVAMIVPAAANLLLALILIPRFGVVGAAQATAAAYALGTLASWPLRRRALDLPLPWKTIAQAGLAAGLMSAVVALLPSPHGLLELLLKAGVGGLVYAAAVLTMDVSGVRSQAARILRVLQPRAAI